MKRKMICKECKSDNIRFDAWAEWDEHKQEYTLANVFDFCYCVECDGETKYLEIELIEDNGKK